MTYETLEVSAKDQILRITLDRPDQMNALNLKMSDELRDVFEREMSQRHNRAIVLTGRGRAFCSGGDMVEFLDSVKTDPAEVMEAAVRKSHEIIMQIRKVEVPVIAAVNGAAVGSGCNIALACDIKIAARSARFSARFVRNAFSPDTGGTYILPRLVGFTRASELLLTGDMVDAERAAEIGMINRVVDDDDLERVTDEWAQRLATAATTALIYAKRLLNRSFLPELAAHLDAEKQCIVATATTKDYEEGVSAFLEKRAPNFTGR